jgi:hypothetical protein
MGPLLFSLGLHPVLKAVHAEHKGVIIRAYIDDIHIIGPDKDVAAAFAMLRGLLAKQNLNVSFGAAKTSAWSPAWETDPSRAATSAVLGPLLDTTERVHMCTGGIKTLGTFIGTDSFTESKCMALICKGAPSFSGDVDRLCTPSPAETSKVEDDFKHACVSLVDFARLNGSSSVHSANALLLRCIVPKIGYMLEMLPPHLVAGAAEAAHALVMSTYCTINDISAEEAAAAFDRMVLPPSLLGCGLRYYPDISPAAFITSRLHTAYAVSTAIADAESAQAAAAAESAADTDSSSSDGAPALARRSAAAPRDPPAHTATSTPSTTPLEDVTAEITAALDLLPAAARVMIDPSDIGSTELDEYKHLQRKMTRCIEEKRAIQVLEAAKSAVSAAVRNSETFRHAQRNLAT